MAKLVMSSFEEVISGVSNRTLNPDDVFVIDPSRVITRSGYASYLIADSLSGVNFGKLFSDNRTEFTYLIRKEDPEENNE